MIETKFKQTELGPIPEDWDIYTLGTVSDIKTGPFGSALHASDYVRFGTPIITVEHLGEPYIIHAPNIPLVGLEDKKRLSQYTLRTGDIVYSRVGSVDRNSVVTEKEDGWLFSGRLLRVRNSGTYYAPYLGYHLNSNNAKKRIVSSAVGLGMPSINTKILGDHVIILPNSIDEQKIIAEALSDVDDLTHELDALIEKKKAVLQGTMQALLTGSHRLPGFSSIWETRPITDICSIKARIGWQGLRSDEFLDSGEYVLVTGTDILQGHVNWSHTYFVSIERFNQDKAIQLKLGDILITKDGTIGKVAFIDKLPKPATLNSGVYVLRPKQGQNIFNGYLSWFFKSSFFDDFIQELRAGSTISHLYQKDFVKLNIFFPSDTAEQRAIAAILSDMDSEIAELEAKREKYAAIRQGMMQQLLTGKIRLI